MQFSSTEYLDWIKAIADVPSNFAFSGRMARDLTDLLDELREVGLPEHAHYGDPLLRERLAQRYGLATDRIALAQGASQANFLVCAAILDKGDEVIVERPTYQPLVRVPQSLGARLRRLDRTFANRYHIDLDALQEAVGPRTRLLILTNLHNPSGTALDREELLQAAEIMARVGGYLLVDEIYFEFLDRPRDSAIHLHDHVIVTSSLTKAFGLGVLRCGWVLGPPELIRRCWQVRHHIDVVGSALGERLAALALTRLSSWLAEDANWLRKNRQMAISALRGHPLLECHEPVHGWIAFPRFCGVRDASAVFPFWQDRFGVIVGPGHFFEAPAHFRIGFPHPPETLKQSLARLRAALDHPGTRERLRV